jgi:hypothetical protein
MKQTHTISFNDRVRVVDSGETYSTWTEQFEKMGFKNTSSNSAFKHGTEATVFSILKHPNFGTFVFGIVDDEGNESLIGQEGIQKLYEFKVPYGTIDAINDKLSQLESKLDQLAKAVIKPEAKPQTAVEWFADQLLGYDYNGADEDCEILMSYEKFLSLKAQAMEMEINQNCK